MFGFSPLSPRSPSGPLLTLCSPLVNRCSSREHVRQFTVPARVRVSASWPLHWFYHIRDNKRSLECRGFAKWLRLVCVICILICTDVLNIRYSNFCIWTFCQIYIWQVWGNAIAKSFTWKISIRHFLSSREHAVLNGLGQDGRCFLTVQFFWKQLLVTHQGSVWIESSLAYELITK